MVRASFFALLVACGGAHRTPSVEVEVAQPLPTVSPSDTPPPAPVVRREDDAEDEGDPRVFAAQSAAALASQAAGFERLVAASARSDPARPGLLLRLAEVEVQLRKAGDADAAAKAVRAYEELTTQYRNFADADRAWFGLAKEYEARGDLPKTRRAYYELILRAPQSRFVPYAYYAFAELFLGEAKSDPSKLAFAEQAYQEVTKFSTSPIAPWALCKLSRCYELEHDGARSANARAMLARDYSGSPAARRCGAP